MGFFIYLYIKSFITKCTLFAIVRSGFFAIVKICQYVSVDDVCNTYVINEASFLYRAEKQKEKYESILDNYNSIFRKCVDPRTAVFPEYDEYSY